MNLGSQHHARLEKVLLLFRAAARLTLVMVQLLTAVSSDESASSMAEFEVDSLFSRPCLQVTIYNHYLPEYSAGSADGGQNSKPIQCDV